MIGKSAFDFWRAECEREDVTFKLSSRQKWFKGSLFSVYHTQYLYKQSLDGSQIISVAEENLRPIHDGVLPLEEVSAWVRGAAPVNSVLILKLVQLGAVERRLNLLALVVFVRPKKINIKTIL